MFPRMAHTVLTQIQNPLIEVCDIFIEKMQLVEGYSYIPSSFQNYNDAMLNRYDGQGL